MELHGPACASCPYLKSETRANIRTLQSEVQLKHTPQNGRKKNAFHMPHPPPTALHNMNASAGDM